MMLEIKDLHVRIASTQTPVLQGLNLCIDDGEVVAIMGQNGSGKSTLSYVLAGRPEYEITSGDIVYQGKSLLSLSPTERARAGVFLAFQYPIEIPGVSLMEFLRAALTAHRKEKGKESLSPSAFLSYVKEAASCLEIPLPMLKRFVNVGFSGGEKKRVEILQMKLLEPQLCILDETDSGLDIDALKIVSHGINTLRSKDRSIILITHYQRLLEYVQPDTVHVLDKGRIIKTGDKNLARELEANGYTDLIKDSLNERSLS